MARARGSRCSSRDRPALLTACGLALALPASAGAHSILNGTGGEISYTTEDVTSLNCLTVEDRGGQVYFRDFEDSRNCVDYGINASGDCSPGTRFDGHGYVYDGQCPRLGKQLVRIDVGPREDVVVARISLPVQLLGGEGADTLTVGDGADVVLGGGGNDRVDAGGGDDLVKDEDGDDAVVAGAGGDTVQGGRGADAYDAGDGDDDVRVRDGVRDVVTCGAGADTVDADQLDELAADCESVTRIETAPPSGGGGGDDSEPPRLEVGASTPQRVGRKRRLRIAATMTERGTIRASGRLAVGGIFLPLKSEARRVSVAGAGVELTVRLGRRPMRLLRRAFRRGKRPYARMDVVATDLAGNSTTARAPRIRLRR